MDIRKESLKKHYEWNGKIEVVSRVPINSAEDLSLAYTPGVAEPCLEIQKDYDKSFELTRRNNSPIFLTSFVLFSYFYHYDTTILVNVTDVIESVWNKSLK